MPNPGSRYDAEITGSTGFVVGDYATVFQIFPEAPAPLRSKIRTREFAPLIEERTRDFVGRDFVFAALQDALDDPMFHSGYLVLQGEPGIGKTAISSRLVIDHGWVHHFNIALQGLRSPQDFLSNVCAQLIVRYKLNHSALPDGATRDGGFMLRLLTEAAEASSNLPIVVVVDAVDEADSSSLPSEVNSLFLPPVLPIGVYFIITTREESDYRLSADSRRDLYLRDDDPRNLEDIRTYIRAYLDKHRVVMRHRIGEWEVPADEFVQVLTEKSEGNFMYLRFVLPDIANGTLGAANVDDIRHLPQGLKDYYRRHWKAMRSADPEFQHYQEPIVCLLATACEPVTAPELLNWTVTYWQQKGWKISDLSPLAVHDVLNAWRKFLNEDRADGETCYRIYHSSFQDFLATEVGLATYHATIGETALAKIPGFLSDL
jgi:hypothetical protein